jgi:hypothetical protein
VEERAGDPQAARRLREGCLTARHNRNAARSAYIGEVVKAPLTKARIDRTCSNIRSSARRVILLVVQLSASLSDISTMAA